jgi:hypothetical protein
MTGGCSEGPAIRSCVGAQIRSASNTAGSIHNSGRRRAKRASLRSSDPVSSRTRKEEKTYRCLRGAIGQFAKAHRGDIDLIRKEYYACLQSPDTPARAPGVPGAFIFCLPPWLCVYACFSAKATAAHHTSCTTDSTQVAKYLRYISSRVSSINWIVLPPDPILV